MSASRWCGSLLPASERRVLRVEERRIPIRFKIRIVATTRRIYFIFVAIDKIGIPMGTKLDRHQIQSVLRELVIMIDECNKFARGHLECGIGSGGDMAIIFAKCDFDS